ncbi:hypothetical protein DFQ26_002371 [Actinomortierella ambigua]|nr:hypothetical protein DFQ26_002371 [Actinomortierella ambigua]
MLPSEWPMAPWAIRTEAALLENEAMHQPFRRRPTSSLLQSPSSSSSSSSSSQPLVTCGYAIDKRLTREEYNDDLFEGDMLQAWISTLASEKQEAAAAAAATAAAEQAEQEAASADPVVLDMALRRLQRLMVQLRVSSARSEATHPHLVAATAAASSIQQEMTHWK